MRLPGFLRFLLLPILVLVPFLGLLSASLFGYSNLTDETLIAEVSFKQLSEDEYLVNIATGDFCDVRSYVVEGDQWRLDASFLKWKYWAQALGLDSHYRLDRLEGRYSDIKRQNLSDGMSHQLSEPTVLDIAGFSSQLGSMNVLADAAYGSSTFQAIDETRIFDVYKTGTGIITREREAPDFDVQEGVLAIEINHACGGEPGVWQRFSLALNRMLVPLLQ